MTVPIVPGPGEPEPLPVWPQHDETPPPSPVYYPPQPVPVYYPQPPTAPTWAPGRAAGNTVVVILTLVGIFCGLPLLACGFFALMGALTNGR